VIGQLHASAALPPGERAPGTHLIGGSVGPKAGLDDTEKWKFMTVPGFEIRPLGHPALSQSLYRLRYRRSWKFIQLSSYVLLTNRLNRAELFLRNRQLRSHSRIFQGFIEPEGSLPCPQEPSTDPYLEPYTSRSSLPFPPKSYTCPPLPSARYCSCKGKDIATGCACRSQGTANDTGLWDGKRPLAGPKLNWNETVAWFMNE
jgi:hypothetical protein